MSLMQVRPYFSSVLTGIGLVEWDDVFGQDNIPSNVIDKSFHQSFLDFSGITTTAQDMEITVSVGIRIHFKAFRDTNNIMQECIQQCEDAIRACVDPESFKNTTQIKGVYFQSMNIEPFELENNDNIVVAVLAFDCRVFVCIK